MKRSYGKQSKQRQECVISLRKEGLTLQKVGDLCGSISRQAVHKRISGTTLAHEKQRRWANIAILLSLGYSLSETSRELDTSQSKCSRIAHQFNLRHRLEQWKL